MYEKKQIELFGAKPDFTLTLQRFFRVLHQKLAKLRHLPH
jgi:hypothetical protein